jgi:hypothetical protein
MIKKIVIIIFLIFSAILTNEIYQGAKRQKDRQEIYKLAESRAKAINKPLLVYGDPYYGIGTRFFNMFMEGYGCGDETVDLTGCPLCPNCVKSDILVHLKTKKSNSHVIFVSCVLEYIDEIEETITEVKRVAGSLDNIFVVTVKNNSLSAYFYQEDNYKAKNLIQAPPLFKEFTFKKFSGKIS